MNTSNANYLIQLEDVSFSYQKKRPVLSQINLSINQGDYLAVIGPNGGGKTTLFKIILGFLNVSKGNIAYNQCMVDKTTIGYVPQISDLSLDFPIQTIDVVLSGFLSKETLLRRYTAKHYEKARDMLVKLDLEKYEKQYIYELSGGQIQRCLIARALVHSPMILFLDEPTTSVDQENLHILVQLFNDINKTTTIVMITHNINIIAHSAKQIAYINKKLCYHKESKGFHQFRESLYDCSFHFFEESLIDKTS